jgi:protein required for attachment to host cells
MSQYLVAVIDGANARFLTLSPLELEGYESGPNLIEQERLHNAETEMPGQELWANTKTGRNRGAAGQAHSYDDHRSNHRVEFERRFAQTIGGRIAELSQRHHVQQLILVAEPQALGILREVVSSGLPSHLTVHEVNKDLCRLSTKALHDYLAERSLLPAFKRLGV